ncbi:MAG: polysaccharide deacetylase family protein [Actinobacteria bacterium]|nr:polysaccharide deacetylase family protein [Actinomycetota bacterium]MBU4301787.1 polysaccharide deacetylase family protein [Actinomycetota bacterium]
MSPGHRKNTGGPVLITHRDVTGKAFALLLIMVLGVLAVNVAQQLPPEARSGGNVVNALEADGGRIYSLLPVRGERLEGLGLGYMVPRGTVERGGPVSLSTVRDSGLLRAYSAPPDRLASTPEGNCVFLPSSPRVDGPRPAGMIHHGCRSQRKVALTFDTTEVLEPESRVIIETLTALRAPATIFVCGGWCHANPELLRMAIDHGFEIASHSYNHPYFTRLSDAEIEWQLRSTENAVLEIGGAPIAAYFRPPYGDIDARVEQVVCGLGYDIIYWSRDTSDWKPATVQSQIRDRATVGTRGGDIILMHTNGTYTSQALVEIVNNLRADGFELTTVSGVLQP